MIHLQNEHHGKPVYIIMFYIEFWVIHKETLDVSFPFLSSTRISLMGIWPLHRFYIIKQYCIGYTALISCSFVSDF